MTDGNGHSVSNSDINVLKEILMKRGQGVMIQTPGRAAIKPPEPSVTIIEQPKQRGLRFRYKCEGRSAGSIPGESSTNEKKTYPSIKIHNFEGQAAIVVVSCVTKDKPFQPHPHNLVGQDCRDGVCTVKVKNPTAIISFPNIGIQCCKRHDVEENLKVRENIRVDPFGTGYPPPNSNIDLNSVRLCFQVFLPDANKKFTRIVLPIVSQPIIDKKSIHDLVICRLSRQSGYASGGDEVFLLCEKINKDDIQVRFYQESNDGVSWEALGEFSSNDVHRQYAIVFKTPPYENQNIQEPVSVFIQLRRPSDDEVGDPKPFQYIPLDPDPYGVNQKRKRKEIIGSMCTNTRQIPSTVNDEGCKDDPDYGDVSVGGGSRHIKNRLKEKAEKGLLKNKMQNCMDMKSEVNAGEPPKYSINMLSHAEIVSLLQNQSLQASTNFGDLQNSIILIDHSSAFQMQNQVGVALNQIGGGANERTDPDRAPVSDLLSSYIDNVSYPGECLPQLSGLSDIIQPLGSNAGDMNVGAHEMVTEDALQPKQEQPDMMYSHC